MDDKPKRVRKRTPYRALTPEQKARKREMERIRTGSPEAIEARRAKQREQHRKARQDMKGHTGWQRALGLIVEVNPESRLCLRPERVPGVAPYCEDDGPQQPLDNRRTRITLPSLNHPSLQRLLHEDH